MDASLFKRFRLIKNSKNPTTEWSKSNREKHIKVKKINGNAGIPTGKINNITVLDFDFHKVDDRDNKFLREFKDFINDINTYTVKTGSGGFHLYVAYDKELKTTTNTKYHIDIRNDGAYVVGAGSIVNDNEYTVLNNTTIKKIPKGIKEWLINNIYVIKDKPILKDKKMNMTKPTQFKYNVSIQELEEHIKKLKKDTWTDNTLFLKYSTVCKYFDIHDIWDKYNKLNPGYDYNNNINKYWNNLKPSEAIIDEFFSDMYVNYYKYKPVPQNIIKADRYIDNKKLGYDFIDNKNNYIIKSDTGTGKTTSFKHYVKDNNLKFISIVSRITLANEQYVVFNEHGLDCVNYSLRLEDVNDNKFKNNENIVITVDSIIHLYDIDFKNYVIYLDEYNSLLEYLITSSTLHKTRSIVFYKFLNIIKSCKQIICTDADINDISLSFMKQQKPIEYIVNTYQHNKDIEAFELKDVEELITRLKNESKYMVCMDSKERAEGLYSLLDDETIKIYVSGTYEEINLDEHDKIIFSPKIMYGLDSTMKRNVYCFYKEHTISPTGFLQQIGRCRNIDKLYYLFTKKEFTPKLETYEDIVNTTYQTDILAHRYFEMSCMGNTELYNNYLNILNKYLYLHNCYDSNKFAHFRKLLIERGFILAKSKKYAKQQTKIITEEIKEIRQSKLDNFDIKDYMKIHNILKVPDNMIDEYKEYYIKDNKLQSHFNLMAFINETSEDLKNDVIKQNDYGINKIKKSKSKIIYLKKLKEYTQTNQDITNIKVDKNINKTDRDILYQECSLIYGTSLLNKIKNFDNNFNIEAVYPKLYRVLFSSDILQTDIKKKKIEGSDKRTNIRIYNIDTHFIEHNKTLYSYRNTEPIKKLF